VEIQDECVTREIQLSMNDSFYEKPFFNVFPEKEVLGNQDNELDLSKLKVCYLSILLAVIIYKKKVSFTSIYNYLQCVSLAFHLK
jgi:hypothetical protein